VAFVKRFNKVVHVRPANESQSDKEALNAGKTAEGSGNEADTPSTSAHAKLKKKLHLKTFFKEEEKLSEVKNSGARITITADGKADGVQLEELQKQSSLKRKAAHAQRHSAKYNLVSAAVATCLLAFVLSGCAVVAAKIRKRKESIMDYAPVPDTQE